MQQLGICRIIVITTIGFFPLKRKVFWESFLCVWYIFFAWFSQPLFHFFNTNSQIFMSNLSDIIYSWTIFIKRTDNWLLLDCPLKFSEIHIFWEFIEADFVFNGHFFPPVKKKNKKTTSDNNWLLSQLKRLISVFF